MTVNCGMISFRDAFRSAAAREEQIFSRKLCEPSEMMLFRSSINNLLPIKSFRFRSDNWCLPESGKNGVCYFFQLLVFQRLENSAPSKTSD